MDKPSLGPLIDSLYELRAERLEKQKVVDELKSQEAKVQTRIMEMLSSVGLQKATGAVATASYKSALVPDVQDWDKFYEFIDRNKLYHLLQKRVSVPAFNEAVELYNGVDGVDQITVNKLSLTKATK